MLWLCQYIMNWMINIYLVWPHTHTHKNQHITKKDILYSFHSRYIHHWWWNTMFLFLVIHSCFQQQKEKWNCCSFILFWFRHLFFLFISGHPYKVSIYIIVLSNDRLIWNGIWITMQKKNESLNERMKNLTMNNTFYIRRLNSW